MVWLPRRKWCNTANFFVLLFFFKLKINIFFKTFTIKALVQLNIVVLISGHDHIQYKYFHLTLHDTLYHIWILKHKILYLYNYLFNLKEHLLCLMSFILKWGFFCFVFLCDWFVVLIVSFVMLFMAQLWNSQLLCLFRN